VLTAGVRRSITAAIIIIIIIIIITRNRNIRISGTPSNPKAEKSYCKERTQNGPFTHSQSHQAQNTVEHTEVKQRRAWTKEEIREVIWCYIYIYI